MQLIKITNIPIEYQIQVERARLEVQKADNPEMSIHKRPSKLEINTRDVQIRMDTKEMRSSIGLESASTKIRKAAQRGMQAAQSATAQFASEGNTLAHSEAGVGVREIAANRLFSQPETATVFLPSAGPVISWQPNSIKMQYDPGDLETDWRIRQNTMDYVPGKFRMSILQYPKVQIEYLGEPNYVPPSANPNK